MNCRFITIDARTIRVTRALVRPGRFIRIDTWFDMCVSPHHRPGEGSVASS